MYVKVKLSELISEVLKSMEIDTRPSIYESEYSLKLLLNKLPVKEKTNETD